MKVRRDIASIPLRSADDTWSAITKLVSGSDSVDSKQLAAAASVMALLITDEVYVEDPLTFSGAGDRLVLYLRYGHDALELGDEIDRLNWNPTAGEWRLWVPCPDDRFAWAKKTFGLRAPRIQLLHLGERAPDNASAEPVAKGAIAINWGSTEVMSTHVITFTRAHTAKFVSDNMRNLLADIITISGLDTTKLVDDWTVVGNAVRIWLQSGHLQEISIEFFDPVSDKLVTRWDFPISYDGSGADDDMWVAKDHIKRTIDKAGRPPANAHYEIILRNSPGRPDAAGMVPATSRSTVGLASRLSGTAIATPDIMASIKYWKAA